MGLRSPLPWRHQEAGIAPIHDRGIPPEVDRALRRKAALRKQSPNQFVVDELTAATVGSRKRVDFSDLVGKWTPDPAFDAAQRRIDTAKWNESRNRYDSFLSEVTLISRICVGSGERECFPYATPACRAAKDSRTSIANNDLEISALALEDNLLLITREESGHRS